MNKYTKIGSVTGFITASAIAVRCIKKKASTRVKPTRMQYRKRRKNRRVSVGAFISWANTALCVEIAPLPMMLLN